MKDPWEHERIKRLLAREPTALEAEVIATLWSESCSYKSTKAYLSELPALNKHVPVGPFESADVISLDDYKLMLSLDSCNSASIKRKHSAYGAETLGLFSCGPFPPANFLGLGLIKEELHSSSPVLAIKNRILYVGSDSPENIEDRLHQACIACLEQNLSTAIMPLAAGGLALACFLMASKASMGMVLNLDDIYNLDHRRDLKNIILGENTQRMLIAAERHNLVAIKAIFAAHNLACDDIGYVCGDGVVRISYEGYERINLAAMLIWENAPRYRHYYQSIVPKSYGSALSSQISISLGEILDTYNKNLNHEQPKLITVANISKIIGCSWLFYDYLLISNAFEAGKRAVWQGALALSAAGISPGAVAFIYQSGALEKEALMTSFKHCVDGISFACRDLTIPVTATHVHLDTSINKPSLAMGVVGTTTRVSHNDMIQRDYPEHHIIALLGELPAAFSGAESSFKHYPENPPLRAWEYDCIAALSAITYSFVAANHALYTTAVGAGGVIQALFDLMNVTHCGVRLNFGTEWLLSDIPVGLLSQDSPCILTCLPQKNLESLVATCAQKVPIHILGSLTKIRSLAIYHDDKLLEQRLFFQN